MERDQQRVSLEALFLMAQGNEQNHRKLDAKLDTLIENVNQHRVESAGKWAELAETRKDVRKLEVTVANHEKWKNRMWWIAATPGLLMAAAMEWLKSHMGRQ